MDKQLVAIDAKTLASIPFDRLEGRDAEIALVTISRTTHGDRDISMYDGFDVVIASLGEPQEGSFARARFCALLRRRTDGAIRMIRHWAQDGFMETDMMVADGDRWRIDAAFSTHGITTKINVSALCHAYQRTEATTADIQAHDASVLRELSWQARQAEGRAMDSNLARTFRDTAIDLMPHRPGPMTPPAKQPSWYADWGVKNWYVGDTTSIGKHHAVNSHHLKTLVERLDAAGDSEAADTLRWMGWHRDLDVNRDRFLSDEAVTVLHERIAHLEEALRSIADMETQTHHVTDSVMRQMPTTCLSQYRVGQAVDDALSESKRMAHNYGTFAGLPTENTPKD